MTGARRVVVDASDHVTLGLLGTEQQDCVDACSACHDASLATVMHCLGQGGGHAAPEHIRALLDCAQACDAARDTLLRGSVLQIDLCGIAAIAAERCAGSCLAVASGDEVMRHCADICRVCASACTAMAYHGSGPAGP